MVLKNSCFSILFFLTGLDGVPVNFIPWYSGEPNGELINEDCIQAVNTSYLDVRCESFNFCFPCQVEDKIIFRLRGLSDELSERDSGFILPWDRMKQGQKVFNGLLGKSLIKYNRANATWEFRMKQNNEEIIFATLKGAEHFPLGFNTWLLSGKWNKLYQSDNLLQLKFTKVGHIQFSYVSLLCWSTR